MKVALSAPGRFHMFELARELHARQAFAGICTGYPRFKLRNEKLPKDKILTYPWVRTPYVAFKWRDRLPRQLVADWEAWIANSFDAWTSRHVPDCDVFVGLSGSALHTGRRVQERGGRYICDRGSCHIRVQDGLLREEHEIWGMRFQGIDPRVIEREEAEYAQADAITTPSHFAWQTYVDQGISARRIHRLPYGVDLKRFEPVASPDPERFDVLFVGGMSLRKGVQYLVQAYQRLVHPAKSITFVGTPSEALIEHLRRLKLWPEDARVTGHVPQTELKHLMSKSHVMVLPSIEDGFGVVMAQAMACACPVIATEHTGARDLYDEGEAGFIVPIRDVDALTQRLQRLIDDPACRARLSANALARVKGMGGWTAYGENALQTYRGLVSP